MTPEQRKMFEDGLKDVLDVTMEEFWFGDLGLERDKDGRIDWSKVQYNKTLLRPSRITKTMKKDASVRRGRKRRAPKNMNIGTQMATEKRSKGRSTLNKRVMPLVSKAGKRKTA